MHTSVSFILDPTMNTNPGQLPIPNAASNPPNYTTMQQPVELAEKYTYAQQPQQQQQNPQQLQPSLQPQQQQQAFQGPGGQQFTGAVQPSMNGQQPYPMNTYPMNPAMNQGVYQPGQPFQQQVVQPVYVQQPVYGQPVMMVPMGLGGLSSVPGMIDCPRCGKRGLTNTHPVTGQTTQ